MSKAEYVPVRDVMTPNVEMIDGLTTITDALKNMRANQISALIVERRGEEDEYGILTVKDIAEHVIEPDQSPDRVNAYEIMDKPVLSIDVKMNIRYAIRLLTRFDLSRALVLENGEAVGVVTLRDMVLRYMETYR
jgi:CBS domain-containing protein